MTITLIAAASENEVIGRDGSLPWHLPVDLRHFKETTMGRAVIMGRRTWDSFDGSLPGRRNIVITRNRSLEVEDAVTATSLDEALDLAGESEEIFIAGGGEIYRIALPLADRVCLTRVHAVIDGDARFPSLDPLQWECVESRRHEADEHNPIACTFETWQRR